MGRERILELLRTYGLTRLEADAYLTLAHRGESTASDMVRALNLHFPQLYDVISALQRKGFVEVQESRPKIYRAVGPRQFVSLKAEEMLKSGQELLEEFESFQKKLVTLRRPSVWITNGINNIIRNITEVINVARNDVLVVCYKELLDRLAKTLNIAVKRNVLSYVITYPEEPAQIATSCFLYKLADKISFRILGASPFLVLAVADCERAVLSPRLRENEPLEEHYGMIFEETITPTLLGESFYSLWSKAKPLDHIKGVAHHPRTFRTFRMAFGEIKELFAGNIVKIRVQGEDLRTGKKLVTEGRLVDLTDSEKVKSFTLQSNGQSMVVGGPYATAEDIEATHITIQSVHKRKISR